MITDSALISNIFCDFFSNVFEPKFLPTQMDQNLINDEINMSNSFIVKNIDNAFASIKIKKCLDKDNISSYILIQDKEFTLPIIRKFILDIFDTGLYPDWINISKIIPIYKNKGKKVDTK